MAVVVKNLDNYKRLLKQFDNLNEYSAQVGLLQEFGGGQIHDNIDETGKRTPGVLTIAEVGAIQEFGAFVGPHSRLGASGRVPERSWLRSTFEKHASKELETQVKKIFRTLISDKGQYSEEVSKGMYVSLGLWAVARVKETFKRDKIEPKPSPKTIEFRSKLGMGLLNLLETGVLFRTITFRVGKATGNV